MNFEFKNLKIQLVSPMVCVHIMNESIKYRGLRLLLYSVEFSSVSMSITKDQAPCRVYFPNAGSGTYWFPYATCIFARPYLPFTRVSPRSHIGSSPLACVSANCSAYPLLQFVRHGGIPYALRPDGFADPEVSSTQAVTPHLHNQSSERESNPCL